MIESRLFPGALKRSFPRINAGAPTTNYEICSSHGISGNLLVPGHSGWEFTKKPAAAFRIARRAL
jgi:hypothetical protein